MDRYVTDLDGEFYLITYSLKSGNVSYGPFPSYREADNYRP